MSLKEVAGWLRQKPWRFATGILVVTVLTGVLFLAPSSSQASPTRSAIGGVAGEACHAYIAQLGAANDSMHPNVASVVDVYSTTSRNLGAWLLKFDPIAYPSVIQKLPGSTKVTACVMHGSWLLPSHSSSGSGQTNYEVVMISPDGTGTPILWGQSDIVTSAPPAA